MNPSLRQKFWDEFIIPFQEKDSSVNFVNPSDLGKALIKARNWSGLLAQEFIRITKEISEQKGVQSLLDRKIRKQELLLLSSVAKMPSWAIKNRETTRVYILKLLAASNKTQELTELLTEYGQYDSFDLILGGLTAEKETIEVMRRALEKTTDWLTIYLSWHKFDIKMTVNHE